MFTVTNFELNGPMCLLLDLKLKWSFSYDGHSLNSFTSFRCYGKIDIIINSCFQLGFPKQINDRQ